MERRPITALSIAAAVFLSAGLGACSTPASQPTPNETTIVDPPSPPPTEEQVEETPHSVALGQSYTYDSGLTVTVAQVATGVADEYDYSLPAGTEYPIYEFTITNGADVPFDPAMAMATVNYGDQGLPAESKSSYGDGTTYTFTGVVLPGKSSSIRTGYAVPAGESVVITFAPDLESAPAVFTTE